VATSIAYRASVSFEYVEKAPQTFQGEITAANHAQAVRRAFVAASRAIPNSRPRSFVLVLEERSRRVLQPSAQAASLECM